MERNLLQEGLWETEGVLPYDAACKRLLSEREILARIMKECLPEYGQCTVEDIAFRYIKDDPLVDGVPLRGKAPRVGGLRNDEAVPHEGRVTYDIRFTAEAPGVEGPIGLIVNVEAQRRSDQGRRLMSRAMYYCARMLSAQYGEVFSHSHYENLRKVYSIWICPNPAAGQENTISRYSMRREDIAGRPCEEEPFFDLMSVVMVRLGKPGSAGYNGILDLLGRLLSKEVPGSEKLRVLEDEYGIALTDELESEVSRMGSFAEHIYFEAREEGLVDGRREGLAEGLTEGLAEGRASGLAEGRRVAMEEAVRSLMASTGWDERKAMEALGMVAGQEL